MSTMVNIGETFSRRQCDRALFFEHYGGVRSKSKFGALVWQAFQRHSDGRRLLWSRVKQLGLQNGYEQLRHQSGSESSSRYHKASWRFAKSIQACSDGPLQCDSVAINVSAGWELKFDGSCERLPDDVFPLAYISAHSADIPDVISRLKRCPSGDARMWVVSAAPPPPLPSGRDWVSLVRDAILPRLSPISKALILEAIASMEYVNREPVTDSMWPLHAMRAELIWAIMGARLT